ncbi:MAG: oligosaccharide flippase family protein [Smithella sp.]
MLRAFLRDSIIYSLPAFLSRGISILLVPLYTRVLSPADYGALDMLMVFGSIVNLTVALEVSQGVAIYYADEKNPDNQILYASTAFWFTVIWYSIFLFFGLIFTPILCRLVMGDNGLEKIFQLGVFYLWLNGLFYLIQNQFRWELRSVSYAIISLLVTIVTASVAVTLAYGLKWGLSGILFGMIIGAFVGCIYGLWNLRKSFRFRFRWSCLKDMLRFSIPMVPSGITAFVSLYIDRLMINHYLSLDGVGLYGIGFRLASVVGLVMVGFQGALMPLVYSHYREEQTPRQLALIFRIFLTLSLMIFLLTSIFAREILQLMTTPAYYSAASLVMYLVPAILLSNMYIFAPGIIIAKKTFFIFWINLAGALLMVPLNWLLISSLGITGAAIAKLLGYACMFAAFMFLSQRLYHIPYSWKPVGISVAVTACLAFWGARIDIGIVGILLKITFLGITCLLSVATSLVRWSEIEKAFLLIKYESNVRINRLLNNL